MTLALLGLVGTVVAHDHGRLGAYYYLAFSIPCAAVLLCLSVANPGATRPGPVLDSRPLVYAGLVSYSVYLWHEPAIRWLDAHGLTLNGGWGFIGNVGIVATVVLIIATVSYYLVERPAMRIRRRTSNSQANKQVQEHSTSTLALRHGRRLLP